MRRTGAPGAAHMYLRHPRVFLCTRGLVSRLLASETPLGNIMSMFRPACR